MKFPNKVFKLVLIGLRFIMGPVAKVMSFFLFSRYSRRVLRHQPVFIIGAPRSGSTILYQVMTNELDVLYVNNLTCSFFTHLPFGFWISQMLGGGKAHNCFQSSHGDTSECGLMAPSECGAFWYRWLPKAKHFVDHDDVTDTMINEIRDEVAAAINYFDKPIVFKNLNAGQRMRLIVQSFPKAKFVFIRRNPLYTAQSILLAKRKIGLADDTYWSVMPADVESLKAMRPYEQIVKQIYFIEQQIVKDKSLVKPDHFMEVNYEDLQHDATLMHLKVFINGNIERAHFDSSNIRVHESVRLNPEEIQSLQLEIDRLDWTEYHD